jgi:hypothetical protein
MDNKKKSKWLWLVFFLFIMGLLLVYKDYPIHTNEIIPIPTPLMSVVPPYYIQADYTPLSPIASQEMEFIPLECFIGSCIPCSNCSVDIYSEIDGKRILESSNLILGNNKTINFIYKHKPTWAYIVLKDKSAGWIRIPKYTKVEGILSLFKNWDNKFGFLSTWITTFFGLITLLGFIFRRKTKEIIKKVVGFIIEYWSTILILVGALLFFIFKSQKLIIGSLLLIFVGLKLYVIPGIKNKDSIFLTGVLTVSLGIMGLLLKIFMPFQVDLYILFFMIILAIILFIYYFLYHNNWVGKGTIFLSIFIFVLLAISTTNIIGSLMSEISNKGFQNWIAYVSSIIFVSISIFIYFLVIKLLIESIFKKSNDYLFFAISIGVFILIGGYFYITEVSSENNLKDFLIVLSIAFFTSLAGVSALKQILKR